MANIADTLKELVQERSRMAGQVKKLDKAIGVLRQLTKGSAGTAGRQLGRKRTMSASARKRIAAAQRARWAKWKAAKKKAA